MPTVLDILASKGSHVHWIGPDATVLEATQVMNEQKIGALVVLDGVHVAGIFTERDVLRRVVVERRDPAETPVSEVMTEEVVCCTLATAVPEARGSMKNRRIRHLPVVDGDRKILGMVSIGDLNAHETASQEQTIHLLHEYLYGRV